MTEASQSIQTLVARFDPSVFDASPRRTTRIRLEVTGEGAWEVAVRDGRATVGPADGRADATLTADPDSWRQLAADYRAGMGAYQLRRLSIRRNLHVGVGFLAATSGASDPGRLRFHTAATPRARVSIMEAGTGPPVLALHGLGGTKASFLPTVAALADRFRVIAVDLPGFGDSDKPIGAAYDARFFADGRSICSTCSTSTGPIWSATASAGGSRSRSVSSGPTVSGAWRCWLRRWPGGAIGAGPAVTAHAARARARAARAYERGDGDRASMIPGADQGWAAAGVDEFLRAYLTPAGLRRSTPRPARSTSRNRTASTGSGPGSGRSDPTRCSSGAGETSSSRSRSPAT